MATQVQFRGGTTSEHSTFTGVAREVTVDTTKKTVVVHDGSTAGGIPLAKESAVTSAAAITGGSINGTTVGASTASTGAFTTLSASSTVSGTGFSTYLASPPAIGGTTASTGRFTTVTATGLTSGRVTYAGASGLLSDSAGLTYNGASLTISSGASASALIATSTSSGGTALNIQNNGTVNALIGGYLSCIGSGSATDVAIAAYQGALAFATNGANERMRITSTGLVGIGTSSPQANLQVTSSAFPVLKVADAIGGGALALGDEGTNNNYVGVWRGTANSISGGGFLNVQGNGIAFMSSDNVFGSASERMRLNSDGQLLLGTTSAFNSAYTMSLKVSGSTGGLIIQPGADSYTAIQFNNAAGSGVGSISVSSTLTSYNVTSDQRLKTNIVDAPSGNIDDIKVRSFDWIADGSHQEYGMVAQELIEVAPYAVHQPENPDDMMGVDYSKLVPMMIKEIQDLKQRIATLENK